MKNLSQLFCALLILVFASSCVAEKITSFEDAASFTQKVDTIITFDPDTYEETIMLVVSDEVTTDKVTKYVYRTDTIITFNADTYEESIEIVKTKVPVDKKKN